MRHDSSESVDAVFLGKVIFLPKVVALKRLRPILNNARDENRDSGEPSITMNTKDALGMSRWMKRGIALVLTGALMSVSSVQAEDDVDLAAIVEEMQAMKARITELETKLAAAEAKTDKVEQKADQAMEVASTAPAAPAPAMAMSDTDDLLAPPSLPDVPQGWWNKTSIGGYGELHLNLGDKEEIDFHRFVLFVNHDFNERLRLVTELELEHSLAGDGKPGEVELEQAYIEGDFGDGWSLRGGLFLLPVGLLNEYHEPNTFYGTERNFVEAEVIPTTWWEGGIGLNKRFDNGLTLDASVHSGLDVESDGSSAYRIRSGRKKVAEAPAGEWATTLNAEYNGIAGVNIGGSFQYQSDITQTTNSEDNQAWFAEAHVDYRVGGFGLRALYGHWNISGDTPASLGLDQQSGFYIEPSYRFDTSIGEMGVFARYSHLDSARLDTGVYDVGINYWPHENVVLKADYTRVDDATDQDFLNFGIGYQF